MGIFVNAIENKELNYNPGAVEVDTSYNLGDGSHQVKISGSGTNVSVGAGYTSIKHIGNNATIDASGAGTKKITSTGHNKTILTGDGHDEVSSLGDNVKIDTGSGNDKVTFIGDNNKVNTGAGDDKLVFWGNYCDIKMGDGDDEATTFDQVYGDDVESAFSQEFINSLETGTHEDWTLKSSDLIDYQVHKKKSFCRTKITEIYVYENHYNVDTILSRYVNMKGTTIDMGDGNNKTNVTLGDGSSITSNGTAVTSIQGDIKVNKKYSIDELIDSRDEVKIETYTHTTKKTGWKAIANMVVGAIIVIGSVILGCFTGGAGWALAGVGAAMLTGEGVAAHGAREGAVHGGSHG